MPTNAGWLLDKRKSLTESDIDLLDRELADSGADDRSGRKRRPTLALSVHDVVIHDTRKWFGAADVRLDILVIAGYGDPGISNSFYMPRTATFARVRDGDRLQIGPGGLLAFHGPVSHFLDIRVMASVDRKGADDLATLLAKSAQSDQLQGAFGSLAALVAAPHVAAVKAGIEAAGVIGEAAYRVLQAATGNTIGVYLNSHLEVRDEFGIGRHPGPGAEVFRVNDLSFRYEIAVER